MSFQYREMSNAFVTELSYVVQKEGDDTISDRQKVVLSSIKNNPVCKRKESKNIIDIPYGSIIRDLDFLQKNGYIER